MTDPSRVSAPAASWNVNRTPVAQGERFEIWYNADFKGDAVAATGATSKKDMGKVMKEVMVRVKGQADGKLVSRLVGAVLP